MYTIRHIEQSLYPYFLSYSLRTHTGDFHDTIFDKYAVAFTPITGSEYTVTIYPTTRFENEFVTFKPTINCVIVVVIIAFTAFLVLLYSHLVKNRENLLREEAARSIADASSRDAVLHAKKLYVRYISHEIRTPLNAAHLGLKILENEIRKEKGPHARNRLATVQDIAHACDIAVGILNDLLNYDRLEDGTLIIEPRKILALPFFISTTNLFLLQAEEKGVTFKFDVAEFSHHNDVIMSAGAGAAGPHLKRALSEIQATEHFLGNGDYVNVDKHKMSQVVRNLVSNAIKVLSLYKRVTYYFFSPSFLFLYSFLFIFILIFIFTSILRYSSPLRVAPSLSG